MTDAIEIHESISQPSDGVWQVVQRDMERVETRGGSYWKCRRIWSGSFEASVEASRESITWLRERYAAVADIRPEQEAAHMRGVKAAEREAIAVMVARRTLHDPHDPFKSLRGAA